MLLAFLLKNNLIRALEFFVKIRDILEISISIQKENKSRIRSVKESKPTQNFSRQRLNQP